MPRRVRMPAADELFRTTAGNGTLVREGRENGHEGREGREGRDGREDREGRGEDRGEDDAERADRPGRDRGHHPVGAPNGSAAPAASGLKGPARTASAAVPDQASGKPVAEPAAAPPAAPQAQAPTGPAAPPAAPAPAPARKVTAPRRPSGRERHDEKITVYVSPDELLGLEHARIMLRGEYGLAVDRGRIVREAVAALLADLDARGRDSILVKRLSAGG